MAEVKFFKVNTLPGTLQASAIYFVANGSYAETYVTDSSAVAKMVGNSSMINTLVATAIAAIGGGQQTIVANIAARNALTPPGNIIVFVRDATGDTTVSSGAASYLYDYANTTWIKLTEYESLDLVLSWSTLSGKPSSTPSAIDAAVTNSHTHTNKATLDLVTAVSDVLQYNGDAIKNWNTINW